MASPDLHAAGQAFGALSAQNARIAAGNRRILLLSSLATLVTSIIITLIIDATRTSSARRYAAAVNWMATTQKTCDIALARRRLWFGPVLASRDLCVPHALHSSQVSHENVPRPSFSFLVVGDWGRDGMCCQNDVAIEMARLANLTNPAFIVSTGDNFYLKGIVASSDAQVDRSWRDVFIKPHVSLQREWKVVLGNHDYEGNPIAQTVLSTTDKYWHMPSQYFFETAADGAIFIAFLDTTSMFYKPDQMSVFHKDGTTSEYKAKQLTALETALSHSVAPWKIVVGHHPLISSGQNSLSELDNLRQMRNTLLPIFKRHKIAAYFCGHEHVLEHDLIEGVHLFISGAGSKIVPIYRRWPETVFTLNRQGFLQVSLDKDADVMGVTFYDLSGAVVHHTTVNRPI